MRTSWKEAPPHIRRKVENAWHEFGLRAGVLRAQGLGYCWPRAELPTPVTDEVERLIAAGESAAAYSYRNAFGEAFEDERLGLRAVRCQAKWARETSIEDDAARREQAKKDEAEAAKKREKLVAARAKQLAADDAALRQREFIARAAQEIPQ